MDLRLIDFDSPSEVREFEKGRFEVFEVGPMVLGRATYEPGWKWSEHVGAARGESLCQVEHVGLVLEGRVVIAMADGTEVVAKAGEFFYVPPGQRQLGGRRRALRLAPHHGRREVRDVITKARFAFRREGETLAGDLYLPEGAKPDGTLVAVGPLTSVKEQAADNPQRNVLLIAKSQLVLDQSIAGLSDLGYNAEETNDFHRRGTDLDISRVPRWDLPAGPTPDR
jgi:hypothetical protein